MMPVLSTISSSSSVVVGACVVVVVITTTTIIVVAIRMDVGKADDAALAWFLLVVDR